MSFLLDTDLLSEPIKERPNSQALSWLEQYESALYTSAITLAELAYGVARTPFGAKRTRYQKHLNLIIESMGERILRFDSRTALVWGDLQSELEREGHKMPLADSYIAAIAKRHNLIIATGNTAHFTRAGLRTINPFSL